MCEPDCIETLLSRLSSLNRFVDEGRPNSVAAATPNSFSSRAQEKLAGLYKVVESNAKFVDPKIAEQRKKLPIFKRREELIQGSSKGYNEMLENALESMKLTAYFAKKAVINKQEFADQAIRAVDSAKMAAEMAQKAVDDSEKIMNELVINVDAISHENTLKYALENMKLTANLAEKAVINKQEFADQAIRAVNSAKMAAEMAQKAAGQAIRAVNSAKMAAEMAQKAADQAIRAVNSAKMAAEMAQKAVDDSEKIMNELRGKDD